ncbi:MAG: Zn-ribbon domain-containing OB-fold protein [Methyloligellaceae bacterium]
MESPPLLKPSIYKEEGTPSLPENPALLGGKCSCGYVFFPMQTYGCEKCGHHGEALQATELTGRGRIIASTKVHLHAGKRETPFIVAAIELEDGPVVRTLMDTPEAQVSPGDPVVTVLVNTADPETGEARRDLRFSKI